MSETKFEKIMVSEILQEDVYLAVRRLLGQGLSTGPLYEGKLPHLHVTIGGEHPDALTVFESPPELKDTIKDRIYVIQV